MLIEEEREQAVGVKGGGSRSKRRKQHGSCCNWSSFCISKSRSSNGSGIAAVESGKTGGWNASWTHRVGAEGLGSRVDIRSWNLKRRNWLGSNSRRRRKQEVKKEELQQM